MSCKVNKLDEHRVELTIEVESGEFDKAVDAAAIKTAQKLKIPGFRPGKAPRRVVENFVGREYLANEAFEGIAYRELMKELRANDLRMYGQPEVEPEQVEIGKPLQFKAVVTLFPQVELGEYKAVEVPFTVEAVSEEAIDERITSMQRSKSRLVSVEQPIENGDYAMIDFVGYIDGKEFEGGKAESYLLEIGSGRFIPGFEEQLIGAKQDDDVKVEAAFPADYHMRDLAGKDVVFEVTVKDVRRREMPEITSEVIKELSGCEDMDTWRQQVRERLQSEAEQKADRQFRDDVLDKVVVNAKLDLPTQMVEEHIDSMLDRMNSRLQHQGMDIEGYLQYRGETMEQLRDSYRPLADKDLRRDLVLGAVAKTDGLQIEDAELDSELENLAVMYRTKADKLRKQYSKNGGLDNLRFDMLLRKAEQQLVDAAVKISSAAE